MRWLDAAHFHVWHWCRQHPADVIALVKIVTLFGLLWVFFKIASPEIQIAMGAIAVVAAGVWTLAVWYD